MNWQRIDDDNPKDCVVVLTQHVDDLFPVAAFRVRQGRRELWFRETEGPEDTFDGRRGKMEILYRAPTHFQELPESPFSQEAKRRKG